MTEIPIEKLVTMTYVPNESRESKGLNLSDLDIEYMQTCDKIIKQLESKYPGKRIQVGNLDIRVYK